MTPDTRSPRPVTDDADPLATTMGRPADLLGGPKPPPIVVATRYAIRSYIAAGGLGEVFRATDLRLGRDVALKLSTTTDPASLDRFDREAAITARLAHPAIIAVHDRGRLPDGRAWFTMRLVEGRTLTAVIAELHAAQTAADAWQPTEAGWSLRRLVDVLARVAEAVAFAHQEGVIHRDLKPDNIMVGAFGEVQLMDWGLAMTFGRASESLELILDPAVAGMPAGTPLYMAPEQFIGDKDALGPATDLWALGGILLHILAGRPPFGPETGLPWPALLGNAPLPTVAERAGDRAASLPAELVNLCGLVRRLEPARRPDDAAAFARELRAWLDGARRHAQALELVEVADTRWPEVASLRGRARNTRRQAADRAAALGPMSPVEAWRPVWALEDRAAEWALRADQVEARWKQDLRAALELDPTLNEAHDRLADHYVERVRLAEAARRPGEVARAEAQLAVHARPRHRPFLSGRGAIDLEVWPDSAEVEVYRFVETDRRLEAQPTGQRGRGPVCAWSLEHGSYLLVVSAPGHATVRLPVVIERGARWTCTPPGADAPLPLVLPAADAVGPDEALVPAGWCVVGGDPLAPDALPRRRVWVEGFVMRRHPVTVGEWLAFLGALEADGRDDALVACAPSAQPTDDGKRASLLTRDAEGRPALRADPAEQGAGPLQAADLPINRVDWRAAMAYADWRARRDGLGWRLPDELEWEKAARGADGRLRPFGDHLLARWAVVLDGFADDAGRRPVGRCPADVSPYGVEGLAGNMRTWCINRWLPGGPRVEGDRLVVEPAPLDDGHLRAVRGAAWSTPGAASRSAARYADPPERRYSSIGLRLLRPWPAASVD